MIVVTGSYGYIGKHITARLLKQSQQVRTLTGHPNRTNPFGSAVEALPFSFDNPEKLAKSLKGASVLFNTYWVRFEYGGATFQQAVQNSATLFECARKAGVAKIVHISVSNASADSTLPYFAGKSRVEDALKRVGVSYSIIRPTLVFGHEDVLVNNIAWLMRWFPVFPIFGSGKYKIQPVHVEDVAAIAVASADDPNSLAIDAAGPEVFSYKDFIRLIAAQVKPSTLLIHLPPFLGVALGRLIGLALRDVVLTRTELKGLTQLPLHEVWIC